MPQKESHTTNVVELLWRLWHPMNAKHRQLLSDHITIHSFKRREVIYSPEMRPDNLFFLVEGKVIIKNISSRHNHILRLLGPEDVFGYRAHFTGGHYYSRAICLESSVIATLPMDILDCIVTGEPSVGLYFTKQLSHLLAISDTRGELLSQLPLRGRLAQTLLYLEEKYGEEEGVTALDVRLTREELGELSNMNTSNAIRTLSQFSLEGIVRTEGKKIILLDKEKLQKEISTLTDPPKVGSEK